MDRHDRQPSTLSESDTDTQPGVKLAGRYRLTARISRGAFTDIWQAEDEVLGRTVAVKILRREALDDGALKRLFRIEALAAARLTHSNIISIFDTGEHEGAPFLVMEYLGGGSLRDVLDNGPIHPLRAAEWGGEICTALAHAHQAGIAHGAIRPENILFTEAGHLKVSDFAIARATSSTSPEHRSSTGSGSAYSPPEPNGGALGDLYSLGVVLFECLVGCTPDRAMFDSESGGPPIPRPGAFRPGIPVELDAAVLKLLSKDPAKRFQSSGALRSTLIGLLEDIPAPARTAPARPAPARPAPAPRGAPAPGPGRKPVPSGPGRKPVPSPSHRARPAARPKAPAPRRAAPRPRDTFIRTEGRWLLPTILVIAAAVAIALLVPSVRSGIKKAVSQPAPVASPLTIARSFDYDPPPGDGQENSGRVPLAFDGNPSTAWATTSYKTPDFGRLKQGVGIAFDLGSARELTGVKVSSVTGGWQGTLRFSDDGQSFSSPGAGQTAAVDQTFPASGSHRYWMVWITSLVNTPGEGTADNIYSVAIREIVPQGR